jgi:signal peptidase I
MANKWFAAALGLFVPPLAFIYLAKLRIAALYFLLLVCSRCADVYLTSAIGFPFLTLLLALFAPAHAFTLAKSVSFSGDRKWYSNWWGALSIPIFLLTVMFLIRSFIAEPFSIPSASMSPSLEPGDHVLVKKWGYGLYGAFGITLVNQNIKYRTPLRRGEIAVVIPPHDSRFFVERVIGIPGDVIEFDNKQLIINGIAIETKISTNGVMHEAFDQNISTVKYINDKSLFRSGKWTVPDGRYFVMGDNRDNSLDSRAWGMLPAENVVGRFLFKW